MMKYIIWGAGERGKRIFPHLGEKNVDAFIDIDPKKVGKELFGKRIISINGYKKKYYNDWIIISYSYEDEVIDILSQNNLYHFFRMSDCPGEFQESNPRDILKNYVIGLLNLEERFVIYGCTLYSFMLNEWIKEMTGKYVPVIAHLGTSNDYISDLKDAYKEQFIYEIDEVDIENYDKVLLTVEDSISDNWYGLPKSRMINVYDCSDRIAEYYNPKIEQFKDIHKDQRCFIVATGPSLRMEDLEVLKENTEICFSMNSIWNAFKMTQWRPTYYVADDYRIMRDYEERLDEIEAYLFLGDTNEDYWSKRHTDNIIKHHFNYEYKEKVLPKFSKDFSRQCYMGATVTYSCMQLAAYMGFREIYLLGVDFSCAGERNMRYNHFFEEKTLSSVGFPDAVLLAYQAAKKYTEEHNIKIYNATRGGKLELFERVDFDSLF